LDSIDIKILNELQTDSSVSNQQLADAVALSPSPCSRRVNQLENQGFIKKYVALIDPQKLGLDLTIFVFVALNGHEPEKMRNFENKVFLLSEIVECHLITGHSSDYLLKIMVPSLEHYRNFLLEKLTPIKGVVNVHSNFVLESIRNSTKVPLKHLQTTS